MKQDLRLYEGEAQPEMHAISETVVRPCLVNFCAIEHLVVVIVVRVKQDRVGGHIP